MSVLRLGYVSILVTTLFHGPPNGNTSCIGLVSKPSTRVVNVVVEVVWLHNLLRELSCPLSRIAIVFCDIISVIYMASNPVRHQITKYVEIGLHFVKEHSAIGHVCVVHVPSAHQFC